MRWQVKSGAVTLRQRFGSAFKFNTSATLASVQLLQTAMWVIAKIR